jgi:hypothetical protein
MNTTVTATLYDVPYEIADKVFKYLSQFNGRVYVQHGTTLLTGSFNHDVVDIEWREPVRLLEDKHEETPKKEEEGIRIFRLKKWYDTKE